MEVIAIAYAMYLRKSRKDLEAEARGEGETLARHEAALNELASRYNLEISKTYREIESGETIAERPEMQKLLAGVQQGKWEGVFVHEVERLARGDSIDQGIVSQTFSATGTKIYTPGKIYDPTNEFDEEYFEFGLFMSRREYKTIRRRMLAGRIASVKEGKYMGKNDPFGYRRVKLENEKGWSLEIVPEQAEVVRQIYQWTIAGAGANTIAKRLHAMGLKTRVGAQWSPASVRQLLMNEIYCGYVTWGHKTSKKVVDGNTVTRKRTRTDDYIKIKGRHDPIVSEEIWEAAQRAARSRPAIKVRGDRQMRNPYQGMIYCAKCGHALQLATHKRGGHTYYSLFCPWHTCDNVSSQMEAIDDAVIASLRAWVVGYETEAAAMETQQAQCAEIEFSLNALQREMQKVSEQLERAFEFVETGIYTPAQFADRQRVLTQKQTGLRAEIDAAEAGLQTLQMQLDLRDQILPRVEYVIDALQSAKTAQEKHDLIQTIISRITYQKDAPLYKKDGNSDIVLKIHTIVQKL